VSLDPHEWIVAMWILLLTFFVAAGIMQVNKVHKERGLVPSVHYTKR